MNTLNNTNNSNFPTSTPPAPYPPFPAMNEDKEKIFNAVVKFQITANSRRAVNKPLNKKASDWKKAVFEGRSIQSLETELSSMPFTLDIKAYLAQCMRSLPLVYELFVRYGEMKWRNQRFSRFTRMQRYEDGVLNSIQEKLGVPLWMVLFGIGHWAPKKHWKKKGPLKIKGMARLLMKRGSSVGRLDESYTSKHCAACGVYDKVGLNSKFLRLPVVPRTSKSRTRVAKKEQHLKVLKEKQRDRARVRRGGGNHIIRQDMDSQRLTITLSLSNGVVNSLRHSAVAAVAAAEAAAFAAAVKAAEAAEAAGLGLGTRARHAGRPAAAAPPPRLPANAAPNPLRRQREHLPDDDNAPRLPENDDPNLLWRQLVDFPDDDDGDDIDNFFDYADFIDDDDADDDDVVGDGNDDDVVGDGNNGGEQPVKKLKPGEQPVKQPNPGTRRTRKLLCCATCGCYKHRDLNAAVNQLLILKAVLRGAPRPSHLPIYIPK